MGHSTEYHQWVTHRSWNHGDKPTAPRFQEQQAEALAGCSQDVSVATAVPSSLHSFPWGNSALKQPFRPVVTGLPEILFRSLEFKIWLI